MKILVLSMIGAGLPQLLRKMDAQTRAVKKDHPDSIGVVIGRFPSDQNPQEGALHIVNYAEIRALLPEISPWKVAEDIIEAEKPDLVYMRYPLADQNLYRLVSRYPRRFVFEHQTKELPELELRTQGSQKENEEKYGPGCLENAAALVAVTDEIARYETGRLRSGIRSEIPILAQANGIDVDGIPRAADKTTDRNEKLEFLSAAYFDRWHGMERFIAGLNRYRGKRKIVVHVAGNGEMLGEYRQQIAKNRQQDNFIFYGQVGEEKLAAIADRCDAGIGVLAPQRKGLDETAAIKHREYAARGLPFIFAGGDPDFTAAQSFVQIFPADETPIPVDRVVQWLEDGKTTDHTRDRIRAYAYRNLGWDRKGRQLSDFLRRVADDRGITQCRAGVKTQEEVTAAIVEDYLEEAATRLSAQKLLSPQEQYRLASIYQRQQRLDEAEEQFTRLEEQAVEHRELAPGISFHLGEIYYQRKNYQQARRYFARCLEQAPGHGEATRCLEQINGKRGKE